MSFYQRSFHNYVNQAIMTASQQKEKYRKCLKNSHINHDQTVRCCLEYNCAFRDFFPTDMISKPVSSFVLFPKETERKVTIAPRSYEDGMEKFKANMPKYKECVKKAHREKQHCNSRFCIYYD